MWQTQSVWRVRTAHISVLLTVNIVSHNPAQSSSDNIPLNLQTITITRMLSRSGEGAPFLHLFFLPSLFSPSRLGYWAPKAALFQDSRWRQYFYVFLTRSVVCKLDSPHDHHWAQGHTSGKISGWWQFGLILHANPEWHTENDQKVRWPWPIRYLDF